MLNAWLKLPRAREPEGKRVAVMIRVILTFHL